MTRTPLSYPGGKYYAVKLITPYIPQHVTHVCSPFIGGGSIELALGQRGVRVYGYDSFKALVNFWNELLINPKGLADSVRPYYPLTRPEFRKLKQRLYTIKDRHKAATIFYVVNKCAYSGIMNLLHAGMSTGHRNFTPRAIDRLSRFTAPNLSVHHADFKRSIIRHTADFIYADPPYVTSKELYGETGREQCEFDHDALAKLLTTRDNWLLSYGDCERVRDLYAGHDFVDVQWSWRMATPGKKTNEVLIFSKGLSTQPDNLLI